MPINLVGSHRQAACLVCGAGYRVTYYPKFRAGISRTIPNAKVVTAQFRKRKRKFIVSILGWLTRCICLNSDVSMCVKELSTAKRSLFLFIRSMVFLFSPLLQLYRPSVIIAQKTCRRNNISSHQVAKENSKRFGLVTELVLSAFHSPSRTSSPSSRCCIEPSSVLSELPGSNIVRVWLSRLVSCAWE